MNQEPTTNGGGKMKEATFTKATAQRIAKAIKRNVNLYCDKGITVERFRARNRKLWVMADRNEGNTIGSECAARVQLVTNCLLNM